jgi:hypothetical protein
MCWEIYNIVYISFHHVQPHICLDWLYSTFQEVSPTSLDTKKRLQCIPCPSPVVVADPLELHLSHHTVDHIEQNASHLVVASSVDQLMPGLVIRPNGALKYCVFLSYSPPTL